MTAVLDPPPARPTTLAELLGELDELRAVVARTLVDAAREVPLLPGEQLTEREIRLLPYVLGTMQVPEIARELNLSPNTIKTHVAHIYRKLGVNGRRAARLRLSQVKL